MPTAQQFFRADAPSSHGSIQAPGAGDDSIPQTVCFSWSRPSTHRIDHRSRGQGADTGASRAASPEAPGARWTSPLPGLLPRVRWQRAIAKASPPCIALPGTPAMMRRLASCSCGQLTATVSGEPTRISICRCLACQRRTGSVFGAQARFPAEAVAIEGNSSQYVRVGDEGTAARFHFCPDCGATVFYRPEAFPDAVTIPVGAFADPGFPPPRVSVYEERRHPWVGLPDDIEHMD